jgi:hypothetical protein
MVKVADNRLRLKLLKHAMMLHTLLASHRFGNIELGPSNAMAGMSRRVECFKDMLGRHGEGWDPRGRWIYQPEG